MSLRCSYCKGKLYLDYDEDGQYLYCLNCARQFDLKLEPRRRIPTEKERIKIK